MLRSPPKVWVIDTPLAGEMSARLGVAEKLGYPYEIVRIPLMPGCEEKVRHGLRPQPGEKFDDTIGYLKQRFGERLQHADWPDIVITSSFHHTQIATDIKRLSQGKVFTVNIHMPRQDYHQFDLITVPENIPAPTLPNIVRVNGIPHKVTPEKLEEGRRAWGDQLSGMKKPLFAVLVGGDTKEHAFTVEQGHEFGKMIHHMVKEQGGALVISNSRRTSDKTMRAILTEITDIPTYFYDYKNQTDNPYYGLLALADTIIVTGDSMTMCCEATAAGKPVYIYAPHERTNEECRHLHEKLYALDQAKPLTGTFESWDIEPSDAAGEIADAIRARFTARSLRVS